MILKRNYKIEKSGVLLISGYVYIDEIKDVIRTLSLFEVLVTKSAKFWSVKFMESKLDIFE